MTNSVGPAQPVDGKLPDWVHLVPAGTFQGADGRGPYYADAAELVARHVGRPKGRPLVIDFAHQTAAPASAGALGAAAGWIVELQAREDGVWGRVEWTPAGRRAIQDKEYRYLSPVFAHHRDSMIVTSVMGAALVNNPNLSDLTPVLNSMGVAGNEKGEPVTIERLLRAGRDESSPTLETILAGLGLSETETTK